MPVKMPAKDPGLRAHRSRQDRMRGKDIPPQRQALAATRTKQHRQTNIWASHLSLTASISSSCALMARKTDLCMSWSI
jgi:hypothetical protein